MSALVQIRRVPDEPTHGRPCVAEFTSKRGALRVHIERDSGALWLFAWGPSGGDGGGVCFPLRIAEPLLAWIDGGARNAAPSTTGVLWLDKTPEGRTAVIAKRAGVRRKWSMPVDQAAVDELLLGLGEWARAVVRVGADR